MKIKNTKYNIGDMFYTLVENKITETKIRQIQIYVTWSSDEIPKICQERHYCFTSTPNKYETCFSEDKISKYFFKTKQELLASL